MAPSLRKFPQLAPAVVRWGASLVFLIFGIWQLVDPAGWFGYLPSPLPLGLSQSTAIYLNGTLDLLVGLLLLAGLFTRIVALVGAIHLAAIAATLGWNDVMVRDLGLVIVLIGILLHGEDGWSIDARLARRKQTPPDDV